MNDIEIAVVAVWAIYIGFFLIGLLILWAVIRSAVLSALRKHSSEQQPARPEIYQG